MARAVAGYDYEKARTIGHWPVVELLESYEALERRRALDGYRAALLVHAATYPITFTKKRPKPPELPSILKKRDG